MTAGHRHALEPESFSIDLNNATLKLSVLPRGPQDFVLAKFGLTDSKLQFGYGHTFFHTSATAILLSNLSSLPISYTMEDKNLILRRPCTDLMGSLVQS